MLCRWHADQRERPLVCVTGRHVQCEAATQNQCFHVKVYNSRLYFRYLWIIFTKIKNKTVYSKYICLFSLKEPTHYLSFYPISRHILYYTRWQQTTSTQIIYNNICKQASWRPHTVYLVYTKHAAAHVEDRRCTNGNWDDGIFTNHAFNHLSYEQLKLSNI